MGRRPQLQLVKVRASGSALERRRPQPCAGAGRGWAVGVMGVTGGGVCTGPSPWTSGAGVAGAGKTQVKKRHHCGEAAGMLAEEGVRPPGPPALCGESL